MNHEVGMSRPRALRSLLLTVFLYTAASAQLEGHFSLSESSYTAGEPIYLIFEVENKGSQPVLIKTADPQSFCGGYKIEVEGAKAQESLGCYGGVGGSCASSGEVLRPGERHIDRILMNQSYDLRQAGRYSLHVNHELLHGPGDGGLDELRPDGLRENFVAQLEIAVDISDELELKAKFQKYLNDLHSADWHRRFEASRVIAYLAPSFLEDTIIGMLESAELRPFAIRGLRSLGTSGAHDALANFVRNSPSTQRVGEYQDAIRYLGEIGNHEDVAMLLQVAHRNPDSSYSSEVAIESAGKAGGDYAVPLLAAELKDASIEVRQAAVRALYLTGSRSAVPILIELLRSPEERLSGTAEFGLQVLTHFTAAQPNSGIKPGAIYSKWIQWWNAHRQSATMFKYDQCGRVTQIE
jgi:hypothetical protein